MSKVSKISKRRMITFGSVSIIAIVYFFITLFGYIYNYINLQNEEKNLQNELVSLKEEGKYLKLEIQKLNDPTYAIRYAKEKFLFSGEGEYVLKLNPVENKSDIVDEKNNSFPIIVSSVLLFLVLILFLKIRGRKKI